MAEVSAHRPIFFADKLLEGNVSFFIGPKKSAHKN